MGAVGGGGREYLVPGFVRSLLGKDDFERQIEMEAILIESRASSR